MDQNTAQLIEKFRRNPAMAQSLLQSGDGQKLMQMLTRQDGGATLNRAAQSAAMGNTKELAAMLSSLMQSPEGMAVMSRMSELEDKLNSLLSNQDAMAQVMQLAQSLSQSGVGAANGGSAASPPPPQSGAAAGNAMPSAGDLNAMLSQLTGGLDPALLSRLLPVLSQMNRNESSETSALLYALQPFLRDKRRDKVARAAQLAKLIHLAKVFLTTREE